MIPLLAIGAGAALLFLYVKAESLKAAMTTGVPSLDRLRPDIAQGLLLAYGPAASPARARAAIAIVANETSGRTTPPVVGDRSNPKGPSVGPMQVSRARAISLGLVPADESYQAFIARAYDETWCLRAGCRVLKYHELEDPANTDRDLAFALQLYNGPESTEYKEKALSWLGETFGDDPLA